jgi:hypothetical protein
MKVNNSEWARLDFDTFRCPDGRVLRWDDLPDGMKLGRTPDKVIAAAIGCSYTSVKVERHKRGIPMAVETRGGSGRCGKWTDAELRRQNLVAAMRRNFEIEVQRRGYGDCSGTTLQSSAGWMGEVAPEILREQRNIDGSLRRRRPTGRAAAPAPVA